MVTDDRELDDLFNGADEPEAPPDYSDDPVAAVDTALGISDLARGTRAAAAAGRTLNALNAAGELPSLDPRAVSKLAFAASLNPYAAIGVELPDGVVVDRSKFFYGILARNGIARAEELAGAAAAEDRRREEAAKESYLDAVARASGVTRHQVDEAVNDGSFARLDRRLYFG